MEGGAKSNFYTFLGFFFVFVIIALFIAPIINEMLIAYILNQYACQFSQRATFDPVRGFQIITTPLCELEINQRIFLLSIGPLGNLAISIILFLGSVIAKTKNRHKHSLTLAVLFLGFFSFPVFLMLSGEGELYEVFRLGGMEPALWQLPILGGVLLALAVVYLWFCIRRFLREGEV